MTPDNVRLLILTGAIVTVVLIAHAASVLSRMPAVRKAKYQAQACTCRSKPAPPTEAIDMREELKKP